MPPKTPSAEMKRQAEAKLEENVKKEAKTEKEEPEKDASEDKRPVLKEHCVFLPSASTLNVVPAMEGKVLMSLSEGGMQYLIAGARSNVGLKAGRYMYEARILEALNPVETPNQRATGKAPTPKQVVRVGFSTSASGLILGDSEESICFESDGSFYAGKTKRAAVAKRFARGEILAVVLNLDPKSPNANTISLFKDGVRIADPQPLPSNLHGKVLYPHVSFRSVTVQMLFGPTPEKVLPFKCSMVHGAATADVNVEKAVVPKDGKYDVVLPVGFPDEGTFEWLDGFLEKNPQYVELSDRSIQAWATSSGLIKPKGGAKHSNDKPEFNYGLPSMDDGSIRKGIFNIAPVVPRHYIIMEVKSNLVAEERKQFLKKFGAPHFKKIAHVVMGEAPEQFHASQLERLLKQKQQKSDAEWAAKKAAKRADALRKKQVETRQKQLAEMRKKSEEQRKKAAEAAKRKAAGEAEDEPEPMETEEKEEEKEDVEIEEDDEPAPQVELTEAEKKTGFRPAGSAGTSDLTPAVLNTFFAKFSVPKTDEGFDEMRYEWKNAKESNEYLRKWASARKRTARIEDLQPGQWFKVKLDEWLKSHGVWQAKHKEYINSPAKKAKDVERKKKEEAARKAEEEGVDIEEDADAENEVDIFLVEDLLDVGNGEPLFADFAFEDWALLTLRMELYYLQLAFRTDVNDPDRIGIHESNIAFYYNKYFRKQLNPVHFGLKTNAEICGLVKDTVKIESGEQVLVSVLADEPDTFDIFVKLTEENRRERKRRLEAGDESQKLKFTPMAVQQASNPKAAAAKPPGIRPNIVQRA